MGAVLELLVINHPLTAPRGLVALPSAALQGTVEPGDGDVPGTGGSVEGAVPVTCPEHPLGFPEPPEGSRGGGMHKEGPGMEQRCHVPSAEDAVTWSDPRKKGKINLEPPGKEKGACLQDLWRWRGRAGEPRAAPAPCGSCLSPRRNSLLIESHLSSLNTYAGPCF